MARGDASRERAAAAAREGTDSRGGATDGATNPGTGPVAPTAAGGPTGPTGPGAPTAASEPIEAEEATVLPPVAPVTSVAKTPATPAEPTIVDVANDVQPALGSGGRAEGAEHLVDGVVPSIPPPPVAGPWRSYKEVVATLSQRIVDAQRPIRVLNSLRWEPNVFEKFRASRFKDVPVVGPEHYGTVDLGFDTRQKETEFEDIAREVARELPGDPLGQIMVDTAIQYRDLVRMLEARGTPLFYGYSRKLYGSPKDKYPDGKTTVRDSAHVLYAFLTNLQDELGPPNPRDVPARKAVDILNTRLTAYFGESTVRVSEDDGIFADAAAGSDYLKIRTGAMFSMRDIDLFEVHEGWVHLATSLNGQAQPVARWLSKGPPRTTAAQEGLAALLEIFTFRTYPRRARRLNDRVIAVDKAEDGADFAQVFDWYRTEGYEEEECFNATRRIFRGGTTTGGAPFTKDLCYSKGIVLNYAFIRACIEHDRPELIPFLFVGKIEHEDIPVLASRAHDGVVKAPIYLPPVFRDLNGIAIWMSYSTFFTQLGGAAVSEHYARMFRRGT